MGYCIYVRNRTDRPEQTVFTLSLASDLGLHCLPLIQQFLGKSMGNKMDTYSKEIV